METPPVEVVRARAIYLEAMEGIPDVAARVMARIDALCDPERTDEAATLRGWREKYADAITVRRNHAGRAKAGRWTMRTGPPGFAEGDWTVRLRWRW